MTDRDDTFAGSKDREKPSERLDGRLHVTLEVVEGPDKGKKQAISHTRTLLGRKSEELPLSDPTVSGRHAVLEVAGTKLFVTDETSTNGTTLNGARIDTAPCGNLDVIGLGDTKLLLSVVEDKYGTFWPGDDSGVDDSRVGPGSEPTLITRELPNPPIEKSIRIVLDVQEGPDKGKKFQLKSRSTVIGRHVKADFAVHDPTVSSRHCQLEVHNKDKITLKDLVSANGTRLNDQYVSAVKIKHGDVLQIGETRIRILIHILGG